MEVWGDVFGYEGYYEVSTNGRIRSLNGKDRFGRPVRGRELKQMKVYSGNYKKVASSVDGKRDEQMIHRVVALAFIENPEIKPFVNHIDEDPTNNQLNNLEWTTHQENITHGTALQRSKDNTDWNSVSLKLSKPLVQKDMRGNVIAYYEGCRRCERVTGYNHRMISGACNGQFEHAYGFKWEYI